MSSNFAKDVKHILRAQGSALSRQPSGSHEIWHGPTADYPVSMPSRIKSRHTANEILKRANIDQKV